MSSVKSPLVVVMGVAGCGKTSLGRALAEHLAVPFLEGDDFHPPANLASMRAGRPLDDARRAPWLDALHHALRQRREQGAVLSCSALKAAYRGRLVGEEVPLPLHFVHPVIDPAEARRRLSARQGHFFSDSLIDDQFANLEEARGPMVLTLDGCLAPADLLARSLAWLATAADPG